MFSIFGLHLHTIAPGDLIDLLIKAEKHESFDLFRPEPDGCEHRPLGREGVCIWKHLLHRDHAAKVIVAKNILPGLKTHFTNQAKSE